MDAQKGGRRAKKERCVKEAWARILAGESRLGDWDLVSHGRQYLDGEQLTSWRQAREMSSPARPRLGEGEREAPAAAAEVPPAHRAPRNGHGDGDDGGESFGKFTRGDQRPSRNWRDHDGDGGRRRHGRGGHRRDESGRDGKPHRTPAPAVPVAEVALPADAAPPDLCYVCRLNPATVEQKGREVCPTCADAPDAAKVVCRCDTCGGKCEHVKDYVSTKRRDRNLPVTCQGCRSNIG